MITRKYSVQNWPFQLRIQISSWTTDSFIDLGDQALQVLNQSQGGGPLQFVVPGWRTFSVTNNVATTARSNVMTIPARFSSLKSLFIVMTDKHSTPALTYFANASGHYNLAEYYFRVGSEIMPSKRLQSFAEFLAELSRALGSLGDLTAQGLVNELTYCGATTGNLTPNDETANGAGVATFEQCFMIGIDLESYSNADKSAIFSGFNSLTSDIQFVASHNGITTAVNVKYDAFALFDQVFMVENGVAKVMF